MYDHTGLVNIEIVTGGEKKLAAGEDGELCDVGGGETALEDGSADCACSSCQYYVHYVVALHEGQNCHGCECARDVLILHESCQNLV